LGRLGSVRARGGAQEEGGSEETTHVLRNARGLNAIPSSGRDLPCPTSRSIADHRTFLRANRG
jgi:hypothetical protein